MRQFFRRFRSVIAIIQDILRKGIIDVDVWKRYGCPVVIAVAADPNGHGNRPQCGLCHILTLLFQPAARLRQPPGNRSLGNPQFSGNLLCGQPIVVVKDQDIAISGGQHGNFFTQYAVLFPVFGFSGFVCRTRHIFQRIEGKHSPLLSALTPVSFGDVSGNSPKPGLKPRFIPKLWPFAHRGKQNLLRKLIGLVLRKGMPDGKGIDPFRIVRYFVHSLFPPFAYKVSQPALSLGIN